MTPAEQRLAELEAEVAELRRAVVLRDAFLDAVEDRSYRRGRESILGTAAGGTPRPRHLQAVQGSQR
jgi:hypothetical protein